MKCELHVHVEHFSLFGLQSQYTVSELESMRGRGGRIKELEDDIIAESFYGRGETRSAASHRIGEELFQVYDPWLKKKVSHIFQFIVHDNSI